MEIWSIYSLKLNLPLVMMMLKVDTDLYPRSTSSNPCSIMQTGVGWETHITSHTHTLARAHTHADLHKSVTELLPLCPSVHLPWKARVRRPHHEGQCWSPPDSSWWHHTADTCCPEATHFYDVETQRCTMFNQMLPYLHLNHQCGRALPSSCSLHDGCEKRLWVKEAS